MVRKKPRETEKMPWHGPGEPDEVSAIYDDHPRVAFTGGQFDDPTAPWLVVVTWEPAGPAWRPVEVTLRSTRGQPVTASLWREVPVSRAIRWSSARLRAMGRLAAHVGPEAAAPLTERRYAAAADGRVTYDEQHWARVIEAHNAVGARHDRRRAVAQYLAERWPDDPLYQGITSPTSTAARGWLDRLAKQGRITRPTRKTKGGDQG